jgi:hypothetical protein
MTRRESILVLMAKQTQIAMSMLTYVESDQMQYTLLRDSLIQLAVLINELMDEIIYTPPGP